MIKVGIIGGGIAGLSAAYFLNKSGFTDIELIEAKDKIGGRVTSFQEMFTKDTIDNGKHLISGAYTTFFELLDYFGTKNKLYSPDILNVPLLSKEKNYEVTLGNPNKLKQLKSILNIGNKSLSEKIHLILFLASLKINKGFIGKLLNHNHNGTENQTVEQLLQSRKQDNETIKYFWEPITLATLNTTIKKAPADLFLTVLRKAFFADINSQKLYFSLIPMLELINVEENLNQLFKIKSSRFVEKVKQSENGNHILTNKGISICDAVIFAVSPTSLKKIAEESKIEDLIGQAQMKIISDYKYSPIMSFYFWTDQEFMPSNFTAMIGTQFQWIFRETKDRYTLTMSAAGEFAELPRHFIYNLAFAELEMLFPNFERSKVKHQILLTDRSATVEFKPNTARINQRLYKGLYAAGDWTDTGLPATIESATLSGKMAAEELIKDYS